MQNLLFDTRSYLSRGFSELSRRSSRVLSRIKSITASRESSGQILAKNNGKLPSILPKDRDSVHENESGDSGSPLVPARTRKARTRSQVLNMHPINTLTCQVDYLIKQFGLKPQKIGDDRIIVTWPTETNLDCDEKQDPLTMEILISAERGLKFRRISGSSYLFPEKIQVILTLMQEYFGW